MNVYIILNILATDFEVFLSTKLLGYSAVQLSLNFKKQAAVLIF